MAKKKRIFNVRVHSTSHMLELMKELGTLDIELEAESRLGVVRIVAHGTDEEIKALGLKIRGLASSRET